MTNQEIREQLKLHWDIVRERAVFDDYVSCQNALNQIRVLFRQFSKAAVSKASVHWEVSTGGKCDMCEGRGVIFKKAGNETIASQCPRCQKTRR